MTQFASIDHHDMPWRAGQKVETYSADPYTMVVRPNFQRNPTNRYLADIRWDFKSIEEELSLVESHTTRRCFSRDEIDHARKVLQRLANLINDKED